MTTYRVTDVRSYRQHAPGAVFEARLPADVEARALQRGAIEIVARSDPTIQPGSYTPPAGWPFKQEE